MGSWLAVVITLESRKALPSLLVCCQKASGVLPLHVQKRYWIIAFALASQGSWETVRLWTVPANPSIGENKNEPVSIKRAIIFYAIMIYKGNLPRNLSLKIIFSGLFFSLFKKQYPSISLFRALAVSWPSSLGEISDWKRQSRRAPAYFRPVWHWRDGLCIQLKWFHGASRRKRPWLGPSLTS